MLVPELLRHPDDHRGVQAGRVGQELAEVTVVRGLELVLDDRRVAGLHLLAVQIHRERADTLLAGRELDLEADRLVELVDMIHQPGRELVRLVRPHLARIPPHQTPEARCRCGLHHRSSPLYETTHRERRELLWSAPKSCAIPGVSRRPPRQAVATPG